MSNINRPSIIILTLLSSTYYPGYEASQRYPSPVTNALCREKKAAFMRVIAKQICTDRWAPVSSRSAARERRECITRGKTSWSIEMRTHNALGLYGIESGWHFKIINRASGERVGEMQSTRYYCPVLSIRASSLLRHERYSVMPSR